MSARLVFDSHALLTFFQRERGASTVEFWLRKAHRSAESPFLCVINLGEILYATKRAFGDQRKIQVLAHIYRIGFTILPVPNELVFRAAEYKAEHRLSYVDCFVLACAVQHRAAIVTGDPEFRAVTHLVKIHWVDS